jgi:hypothetical protein
MSPTANLVVSVAFLMVVGIIGAIVVVPDDFWTRVTAPSRAPTEGEIAEQQRTADRIAVIVLGVAGGAAVLLFLIWVWRQGSQQAEPSHAEIRRVPEFLLDSGPVDEGEEPVSPATHRVLSVVSVAFFVALGLIVVVGLLPNLSNRARGSKNPVSNAGRIPTNAPPALPIAVHFGMAGMGILVLILLARRSSKSDGEQTVTEAGQIRDSLRSATLRGSGQ